MSNEKENNDKIEIIYKILNKDKNSIRIFGARFVENNKDKCKIIYENKEYELNENIYYNMNNTNDKISIKLIGINNITNASYMFSWIYSLISLPDISKWNTSNIIDMSYMFYKCKLLISLPDISKWDVSNVTHMNNMFYGCKSLLSLPDISKWNIYFLI